VKSQPLRGFCHAVPALLFAPVLNNIIYLFNTPAGVFYFCAGF
jgi:hypothetical protein